MPGLSTTEMEKTGNNTTSMLPTVKEDKKEEIKTIEVDKESESKQKPAEVKKEEKKEEKKEAKKEEKKEAKKEEKKEAKKEESKGTPVVPEGKDQKKEINLDEKIVRKSKEGPIATNAAQALSSALTPEVKKQEIVKGEDK